MEPPKQRNNCTTVMEEKGPHLCDELHEAELKEKGKGWCQTRTEELPPLLSLVAFLNIDLRTKQMERIKKK